MGKIKMVKCTLAQNGGLPSLRNVRFVPLNEYNLWSYLMLHKYGWQVEKEQISYWMDDETYVRESASLTPDRVERVFRVTVEWIDSDNSIITEERYFPDSDYELRRDSFVKHYPAHKFINGVEVISRRLREIPGYFVRRSPAALAKAS
ncbi:MAG: hypothetical protein AB1714_20470 [Acidobacteriota bacterium]